MPVLLTQTIILFQDTSLVYAVGEYDLLAPAPGIPPGAVAQLFQKGYVLNDRLLRPALVVVAPQD